MKSFLLACACLVFCTYYSVAQQSCVTKEYQQQAILRDPSLIYQFESAELFTKKVLSRDASMITYGVSPGGLTIIKIPVVVHILYRTTDENISDEQVRSQIEVLNKEFRKIHADTSKIPVSFRSLAADCYLEFVLATVNPRGYATNGIVRKKTNAYSFGIEDNIKFSQSGGDDAWDSDKYLNIWVANLSAGIIGYSSVLGGPKEKDGIVVKVSAFGSTGKITMPYIKGRTAVHEVGHWLGLRHIWGDQYCGSDGVEDTPTQGIATRGCPSGIVTSCNNDSSGNMYNNYMDLTNDECTNMFTIGQRDKMRAAFAAEGPRHALLFSNGATGIPLPEPPPADSLMEKMIRIFPNPANFMVTVDVSKEEGLLGKVITIHNQLGQLMAQVRITKPVTTINLQSFKEGVYFLRAGNQTKPFKLLKTSGLINP